MDDLREQLEEAGIPLDELHGEVGESLADYAKEHDVTKLYYHDLEGTEERKIEQDIQNRLSGVEIESFIGDHLIHPEDLPFPFTL